MFYHSNGSIDSLILHSTEVFGNVKIDGVGMVMNHLKFSRGCFRYQTLRGYLNVWEGRGVVNGPPTRSALISWSIV